MTEETFRAYVVDETDKGFTGETVVRNIGDLPAGDLLVRVRYSSLNYKDALSASGNRGVTKQYPHTPGIDAVGEVVRTGSPDFNTGDAVLVTGFDLGMNTDGGFGQYIRIPSEWALTLPENLTMKESMIYGTAGFTAGSSVLKIVQTLEPGDGTVLVSGATGGVGSMSVAILSLLGYTVAAITAKESEEEFLRRLGASKIISRSDFDNSQDRPLLKPLYAGAIDTAGGIILDNIVKSTGSGGMVTCCGNVASPDLNLTVFPFILRGVTLAGINSQSSPMPVRKKVWQLLADEWKPDRLEDSTYEITLDGLPERIDLMLQGRVKGRTIVKLD